MAVLHKRGAETKVTALTRLDREIGELIEKSHGSSFDSYLQESGEWEKFYHLSSMRSALFNWYEFRKDAEILEVGGAFGALTGLFCNRCKYVTVVELSSYRASCICERYREYENLEVWTDTIDEIQFEKKFDYIIVTNFLGLSGNAQNDPVLLLKKLKSMLQKDGTLLLAADNRFGLKYFCGVPDFYTNRPFDGINDYPFNGDCKAKNRNEWTELLVAASMEKHKYYYPLPDYMFPQVVYSDDYLPQNSVRDRVISYYVNQDSLVSIEDNLYDGIIKNHMFPYMANSFLIEYSDSSKFCPVIYAAVSGDRGEKHSFVTTIQTGNIVKKAPLYAEGVESLERMQKNLKELDEKGLDVINAKVRNGVMIMPKISSKTLISCMEELIETDKVKFELLFDELYQKILLSSDIVSDDYNTMTGVSLSKDDMGVILKKAYLEMIPYNCFYEDGRYLFFDQEYDRENCPAKFVLFRALRYTYIFIPKAEHVIPLQYFKDKYKMNNVWELFEAEENGFIERNHNIKLFQAFYHWTEVDKNIIYNKFSQHSKSMEIDPIKNMAKSIKAYNNNKEVQIIEKNLLKEFGRVCRENDLHYCAIYGTLLGVVRHSGFIPWDDDIDVVMPREDYDKLINNAATWFQGTLFLQTPENDPECFYGGYIKLRDSSTSGLERINYNHNCNQGIWIDILPLDYCSGNVAKRNRQLKEIQLYQRLLFAKVYPENKERLGMLNKQEFQRYMWFSKILSHKWLCRRLDRAMKKCKENKTEYVSVLAHYLNGADCELLYKCDFEYALVKRFEDLELPIPIGYRRCLNIRMGENYMCFPPEEFRKSHHAVIFSTNIPYEIYIKRLRGINNKGESRYG